MTKNESSTLTAVEESLAMEHSTPERLNAKRALVAVAVLAACLGLAVFSGIHSRLAAETKLRRATQATAIPFVDVVYPKGGSDGGKLHFLAIRRHSRILPSMPGPVAT
jgi:hypothetical protein